MVNPMVVDLSHWDPADDYAKVKADGIVGVIYKATEGQGYNDDTYVEQQQAAKNVGLLWGAYHFADGTNVDGQADNFLSFACPDPDELFVLDWEDNPGGSKMSVSQAKEWITKVETALGRPNECVIYGGNTLKELIDGKDEFFAARRLWLCQYGSTPTLPESWDAYWLWQYTDGVYGPTPHTVDGIGPCDINSYEGTPEELKTSWSKQRLPGPSPEPDYIVGVDFTVPQGVALAVTINGGPIDAKGLPYRPRRKHKPLDGRNASERWRRVRESRHRKEAK